jgi:hypothetical protein
MNARSLYKKMKRRSFFNFWGKRSMFNLVVPASVFPEPCPEFKYPGNDTEFAGNVRKEGNLWIQIHIGNSLCGVCPSFKDERHKNYTIYNLHQDECGYWRWWEGVETIYNKDPNYDWKSKEPYPDPIGTRPLDVKVIKAYADQYDWIQKWIHGSREYDYESFTFVDLLTNANNSAKTQYFSILRDGHYKITWSVKPFYKESLKRFCADIHRIYRAARIEGIQIKGWVE